MDERLPLDADLSSTADLERPWSCCFSEGCTFTVCLCGTCWTAGFPPTLNVLVEEAGLLPSADLSVASELKAAAQLGLSICSGMQEVKGCNYLRACPPGPSHWLTRARKPRLQPTAECCWPLWKRPQRLDELPGCPAAGETFQHSSLLPERGIL